MDNLFKNTDDYINSYPEDIQALLNEIRLTIKLLAPDAEESLSYGMPAYKLYGRPLVYFAAYKNHIGFYATPTGHSEFTAELSKYKQGKGSVQFPIDKPLPIQLISEIIKFRINENFQKTKIKK